MRAASGFEDGHAAGDGVDLRGTHSARVATAWRDAGPTEHLVQFYESDEFLVDSVCGYVRAGLDAGDACVAIVTSAHRDPLEQRLRAAGVDLDALREGATLIISDAAHTLAHFMVDGVPEPECFAERVGRIIRQAAKGHTHVRVFGEMVALLWSEGNATAAVRLEELWNDLRQTDLPFSLCCAYPMRDFAREAHSAQFAEICQQHGRVFPDESYAALNATDAQLRAISVLQQKARSLEAEIAERKAAEERLRISENRYRQLFASSRDGILIVDAVSCAITDANPAAIELLGDAPERILGTDLRHTRLFGDERTARDLLRELNECEVVQFDTLVVRQADGQERLVELVANRFRANGHDVVQCNLREVTDRRRLERRTQEALTALLAIAHATVATPVPTSAEHAAVASHASAERRMAHRLAELTRQVLGCRRVGITAVEPDTERLRAIAVAGLAVDAEPEWWEEQRTAELRRARLGDSAEPDELELLRKGEIFVVDTTASRFRELPNHWGVVTTLVVPMRAHELLVGILSLDFGSHTAHDFTGEEIALAGAVAQLGALVLERERLVAARAAAEANALALQAASRRMDEFLSIVSHELRTPLTVIMANLQILSRTYAGTDEAAGAAGARERVLVERSERQASRLTRLVEDMVDLARIREGKLDLRRDRCDLAAIVREEVELQRQTHPGRVIALELPARAALPIYADCDRIGQIVTNYLTNALKYSDAERPVRVRVQMCEDGATAQVAVRDEGPGIAAEERERVWEMFHRVPGVEVRSGSGVGLGLGLHIARTIVERHGGQVGVESEPGQGSTFWFTLPLAC